MRLQPQFGLVNRLLTNIAAKTATMATPTQRPGWRTGTASIGGFERVCGSSELTVLMSSASS
jgi:hypothetical protein